MLVCYRFDLCQVVFMFVMCLLSSYGVIQGVSICGIYINSVFIRAKSCPLGCTIKCYCMSIGLFMYARDTVLLAPSIPTLQDLLHVGLCETEHHVLQQHCVNGDRVSQWKIENFDLLQNPNPLNRLQKIVTVN